MRLKTGIVLLTAVVALTACATPLPTQKWEARTDANQTADLAQCGKEATGVDQRSLEGYSDSRYGAAAAMTGRLDQVDTTRKSLDRMYNAIVYSCMTRKGWKPVP